MSTSTFYTHKESNFAAFIDFKAGKITKQVLAKKLGALVKKSEQYINNVLEHAETNNLVFIDIMRRLFPSFFIGKNENYYEDLDILWLSILHHLKDIEQPLNKRIKCINDLVNIGLKSKLLPQECEATANKTYKRTILGIEKTLSSSGFESLLLHWKVGSKTPIHGHPHFAYYNILAGACEMVFYKKTKKGELKESKRRTLKQGDFIYSHIANKNNYENLIHSVECIEESFSLHIYSDNALKGKVF